MLINGNLPQLSYFPSAPAPRADVSRRAISEIETPAAVRSSMSSSLITTNLARIDVISGNTPRAQRAISAYIDNESFPRRVEFTQLMGVDVYV